MFCFNINFFHPPALPEKGFVLAITVWIAIWWITEAIRLQQQVFTANFITNWSCVIT